MRIAIDMDEVLADLIVNVIDQYNKVKSSLFKKEDFTTMIWWNVFDCSKEQAWDFCNDFMLNHSMKVKPVIGAQQGVAHLKEGHKLFVVTSRKFEWEDVTNKWLHKYFESMFEEVHFTNLTADGHKIKKSDVSKKLGVDLLIEDQLQFANDCAENGIRVLLLDNPWNQGELHPNITRVFSWEEIVEVVGKLNQAKISQD